MKKEPYTLALLLPTLSPITPIIVYDDEHKQEIIFKGQVIKAADNKQLLSREVKHIGISEISKVRPTLEIFVY